MDNICCYVQNFMNSLESVQEGTLPTSGGVPTALLFGLLLFLFYYSSNGLGAVTQQKQEEG
jgi:nitroreductase